MTEGGERDTIYGGKVLNLHVNWAVAAEGAVRQEWKEGGEAASRVL